MTTATKHRHNIEGGNRRGEDTRAKIVAAALTAFGQSGFEGASMRDIAELAGVNAPALVYYFDNKEGVYLACAEHVASRMLEYAGPAVQAAEKALAGCSDEELINAFCAIQAALAEYMLSPNNDNDWRPFIAREQSGLGLKSSFDILINRFSKRLTALSAAIMGRFLQLPADDEECLVRASTLNGQLVSFYLARRSTLCTLNWDEIDADRLFYLIRIVNEQTAVFLRSLRTSEAKTHGCVRHYTSAMAS